MPKSRQISPVQPVRTPIHTTETEESLVSGLKHTLPPEYVKIHNNVKTALISKPLNLNSLSREFPMFCMKNPAHYSAAVARSVINRKNRCKTERIAVNVFDSGKTVVTGAKYEEEALMSLSNVVSKLRVHLKTNVNANKLSLRNVVATATIGKKIDLKAFSRNPENLLISNYNPDKFPGMSLRLPDKHRPKGNVFNTGKMVLPGPSNVRYAYNCLNWMYNKVLPYTFD